MKEVGGGVVPGLHSPCCRAMEMHGHALFSEACLGVCVFFSSFFIKEHGWLNTAAFTKKRWESWRDSLNDGTASLHPKAFSEAGAPSDASQQNLQPAKPIQSHENCTRGLELAENYQRA